MILDSCCLIKKYNSKIILLCLITVITLFASTSFRGGVSDSSYIYYGVILDEEGSPISGVNIRVYNMFMASVSDQGYYVGTYTSNAEGTYKIPLDSGYFRLIFEKEGYEKIVRDLNFAFVLNVNLGPLTLKRTLFVTLGATERIASPGEQLEVALSLTNTGESTEHVLLSAIARENFTVKFHDEIGTINAIEIAPRETKNLKIDILIPKNATGAYAVGITSRGSTTSTKELKLDIQGEPQAVATCQYNSKIASPGGSVNFEINIKNISYEGTTAFLTLENLPLGWKSIILNNESEQIDSVYLSAENSDIISVRINIPQNTSKGIYLFYLHLKMGDHVENELLRLSIGATDLHLGILTKYPIQIINQGSEASFPLILENPGESPEILNLAMDFLPKNWKGYFVTSTGAEIQSILLDRKEKTTITAVLVPPYDVELNNYMIKVIATSENLKGSLELTVGVKGNTEAKLKIGNLFSQIMVGETKEITLSVQNTGSNTITYPRLEITPSVNTFVCEYSPIDVSTIQPGESRTFTIKLMAMEGTAQGDYLIDVRALSREIATPVSQIRITVQANGGQTLIIGIVLLVALASIVVVYLKFKRR